MSVTIQHDEEGNVYNLGAEIEGVFVPFASVPGDSVAGRIASQRAIEQAAGGGGGGGGAAGGTSSSSSVNPADFTDNGDGTYTRKSDGQTGRFTPGGFETSPTT